MRKNFISPSFLNKNKTKEVEKEKIKRIKKQEKCLGHLY